MVWSFRAQITNTKTQTPKNRILWKIPTPARSALSFGISLGFGIWRLGFSRWKANTPWRHPTIEAKLLHCDQPCSKIIDNAGDK
jgi:hypothetical protein